MGGTKEMAGVPCIGGNFALWFFEVKLQFGELMEMKCNFV
jgi:hypothetical protein